MGVWNYVGMWVFVSEEEEWNHDRVFSFKKFRKLDTWIRERYFFECGTA